MAESLKPYRIALQFANPYAYRGAQMIAEYDTFVRTLLTANHVGLLSGSSTEGLLNTVRAKNSRCFRGAPGLSVLED